MCVRCVPSIPSVPVTANVVRSEIELDCTHVHDSSRICFLLGGQALIEEDVEGFDCSPFGFFSAKNRRIGKASSI